MRTSQYGHAWMTLWLPLDCQPCSREVLRSLEEKNDGNMQAMHAEFGSNTLEFDCPFCNSLL